MSAAVFDTYELVEAILHNLPTKELLLGQRVCRTWRDVTARSEKLQRALFFLPVKGGILWNNWRDDIINLDLWSYTNSTVRMQVFGNPLLSPLFKKMDVSSRTALEARMHSSWQRSDASWRRMLLSQPATMVKVIHEYYGEDHSDCEVKLGGEIMRGRGLTDLIEVSRHELGDYRHWIEGRDVWEKLDDNEQLEMLPAKLPPGRWKIVSNGMYIKAER